MKTVYTPKERGITLNGSCVFTQPDNTKGFFNVPFTDVVLKSNMDID